MKGLRALECIKVSDCVLYIQPGNSPGSVNVQSHVYNLVSGRLLNIFELEPVLLDRSGLSAGSLALDLDLLSLVSLQLRGNVALLGGRWGLGSVELRDVGIGIGRLSGGRLISTKLAEVQVLHRVG